MKKKYLYGIYFGDFFLSLSSMMVRSTFGIYLENVLHVSRFDIGSIHAFSALFTYSAKLFCGIILDCYHNYRFICLLGSIIAVFLKPFFMIFQTTSGLSFIYIADRFAKGIKSSPYDTYLSRMMPEKSGHAIGLKQASFSLGHVLGAMLSSSILIFSQSYFIFIYFISFLPGVIGCIIFWFCIYTFKKGELPTNSIKLSLKKIKDLPSMIWFILFLFAITMVSRVLLTFIPNRLLEVGMPVYIIPVLSILHDVGFCTSSFYGHYIFDKKDWEKTFILSVMILITANLFMMINGNIVVLGVLLEGVHLGISQGLFLTLVSKYSPANIRGTTYALFYITYGLSLFLSGKITGYISHLFKSWQAGYTFGFFASVFLLIIILSQRGVINRHKDYQY